MTRVSRVATVCLSVAAYRWRLDRDDEQFREWRGELYAIGVETDACATRRAYRQICFAASLAASRPMFPQAMPPRDVLSTLWRLISVLGPILLPLAVPVGGVALTHGLDNTFQTSALFWFLREFLREARWGTLATSALGLLLTGLAAVTIGRRTSRTTHPRVNNALAPATESLPWQVGRRSWARTALVPTLLGAGILIATEHPEGYLVSSGHGPAMVPVAVTFWILIITLLTPWSARHHTGTRVAAFVPVGMVALGVPFSIAAGANLTMFLNGNPIAAALVAATGFAIGRAAAGQHRQGTPYPVLSDKATVASASTSDTDTRATATAHGSHPAMPSAIPAMPSAIPAMPSAIPAMPSETRRLSLVVGLGCGVAGTVTMVLALTPTASTIAGPWHEWLDAVRQSAALLAALGYLLVAAIRPGAQLPADRQRRLALGIAITAAYCTWGLFAQGRWQVITDDLAPVPLPAVTAVLTGLLAILAAVSATAARRSPPSARATIALAIAPGSAAAGLGAVTGGDGDTFVVVIASLAGHLFGVIMMLIVWRIVRGRRPRKWRRALAWIAGLLIVLFVGGAQLLDSIAMYATQFLRSFTDEHITSAPSVLGTLVVALMFATAGTTPAHDAGAY